MNKFRHIDPKIIRSESVAKLEIEQRYFWILLILAADDQGRLPGNSLLVRSMIFPLDDITTDKIRQDLNALEEAKLICLYQVEEIQYIQIVKWHWYQKSSEWLGLSEYPAPTGWEDRYRYHGKAKDKGERAPVIKSPNWDSYFLPCPYLAPALPLPCRDCEVEVEVKVNDEDEVEGECDTPAIDNNDNDSLISVFESITGIDAPRDNPKLMDHWNEALHNLQSKGITGEIITSAYRELMAKGGYKIIGPWSLETACLIVAKNKSPTQLERKRDSEGPYSDFILH